MHREGISPHMLCRFPGLELWKCRICILWHHRRTRFQLEPKWTFLVLLKTKWWTSNERSVRIHSLTQWTPIMTARAWRYCTEVLLDVYTHSVFLSLTSHALHCTRSIVQWQHTPTMSMNDCGLEAMLSDWLVWCWTFTCAWLGQIVYHIYCSCPWSLCTIHFLIIHLVTSVLYRCAGG
jgi:hypothetical protein